MLKEKQQHSSSSMQSNDKLERKFFAPGGEFERVSKGKLPTLTLAGYSGESWDESKHPRDAGKFTASDAAHSATTAANDISDKTYGSEGMHTDLEKDEGYHEQAVHHAGNADWKQAKAAHLAAADAHQNMIDEANVKHDDKEITKGRRDKIVQAHSAAIDAHQRAAKEMDKPSTRIDPAAHAAITKRTGIPASDLKKVVHVEHQGGGRYMMILKGGKTVYEDQPLKKHELNTPSKLSDTPYLDAAKEGHVVKGSVEKGFPWEEGGKHPGGEWGKAKSRGFSRAEADARVKALSAHPDVRATMGYHGGKFRVQAIAKSAAGQAHVDKHLAKNVSLSLAFDPDQPRDADGKFASGGGGGSGPGPKLRDPAEGDVIVNMRDKGIARKITGALNSHPGVSAIVSKQGNVLYRLDKNDQDAASHVVKTVTSFSKRSPDDSFSFSSDVQAHNSPDVVRAAQANASSKPSASKTTPDVAAELRAKQALDRSIAGGPNPGENGSMAEHANVAQSPSDRVDQVAAKKLNVMFAGKSFNEPVEGTLQASHESHANSIADKLNQHPGVAAYVHSDPSIHDYSLRKVTFVHNRTDGNAREHAKLVVNDNLVQRYMGTSGAAPSSPIVEYKMPPLGKTT